MKPVYERITPEEAGYHVIATYAAHAAIEVDRLRQERSDGFENLEWMRLFLEGVSEHGGNHYRTFGTELFVHEVLGKPENLRTVTDVMQAAKQLAEKFQRVESAPEDQRKSTLDVLVTFSKTALDKSVELRYRCWG